MRPTTTGRCRPVAALFAALLATPAAAQQAATDSAWLAGKGFQQRASQALLHGDREALRSWGERTVSGVLQTVPRIELRGAGDRFFVLHAADDWQSDSSDEGCVLSVYVNGGRIHPANGSPATVRAVDRVISARDLAGIEVHALDTSPVGEGIGCGAVLLWSRRIRAHVDEEFAGRLRGRATSPEGAPMGGIEVTLDPGGEHQTTDSGGWFDFGALPPGRYTITAASSDGASWTGELVLRAFAISRIDIEVVRHEEGGAW